MDGKLTVTLPHNESRSTTLCIIFMLMCSTRQPFHPCGGKTQAFFVLYFLLVILQNTNRLSISGCVNPQRSCFDTSHSGGKGSALIFPEIQSTHTQKKKNDSKYPGNLFGTLSLFLSLTQCKRGGLAVRAVMLLCV